MEELFWFHAAKSRQTDIIVTAVIGIPAASDQGYQGFFFSRGYEGRPLSRSDFFPDGAGGNGLIDSISADRDDLHGKPVFSNRPRVLDAQKIIGAGQVGAVFGKAHLYRPVDGGRIGKPLF